MTASADLGRLPPDHLRVAELAATVGIEHQLGARHGRAAGVAFAFLGVAVIDPAVAGELRMHDHIAQPTLAAIGHGRYAADLAALAAGRVEVDQLAGFLGDERAAVGQEGHCPGLVEAGRFRGGERPLRGFHRCFGGGVCRVGGAGGGEQGGGQCQRHAEQKGTGHVGLRVQEAMSKWVFTA
ncbi:hypothetical protein D3C81_1218990 [compost metagenome]